MFNSFVTYGANLIGFQEDMFRYLISFFIEIPLCYFFRFLPNNPQLKHFLYGIVGIFIAYFVYSTISLSVFITMIPVYIIMKYIKNKKLGARICFALNISYLVFLHIKRMIDNYLGYDLDFSSLQMVLTIKFTTFAFSISNAYDEEYKTSEYTEKHKIKQFPSILEFFGYTFFFPAYFSGPALEFNDYMNFVTLKQFENYEKDKKEIEKKLNQNNNKNENENENENENQNQNENKNENKEIKIPPIQLKVIISILLKLIIIISLYFIGSYLNLTTNIENLTLRNKEKTFWFEKIILIMIYVNFAKLKYYFCWKFAEFLSILLGFGYNGFYENSTEIKWDFFKNVDIYKMETADSICQIVSNWNIQTEKWLRYYVYERLSQNEKLRNWSSLMTNMVSAFWHGLYPGYYIAFFFMTLQQKFQKMLHIQVLPLLKEKYGESCWHIIVYHIFNYIYTPIAMLYCFAAFILLSFENVFALYGNTYFIPHIFGIGCYLYLKYFPVYKREKKELPKTNENDKKEN